jgi:hypothetical protein
MPIESGITIPHLEHRIDAWRQSLQDGFAYCENISLVVAYPRFDVIDAAVSSIDTELYNNIITLMDKPDTTVFSLFPILAPLAIDKDLLRQLSQSFYLSTPSYLPLLFRMLRDHHIYSLYETLLLISSVRDLIARGDSEVSIKINLFNSHDVLIFVSKLSDDCFLLAGPVVCSAHSPADGLFLSDLNSCLEELNITIERSSPYSATDPSGWNTFNPKGALYNTDSLVRSAFTRQKTGFLQLKIAARKISSLYNAITHSDIILDMHDTIPIHMFSRIAATSSALYDYGLARDAFVNINFDIKTVDTLDNSTQVRLTIDCNGHITRQSPVTLIHEEMLSYYVDRVVDREFTNWQSYITESLDLLYSWLNNKFGYSATMGVKDVTQDRLALFDNDSIRRLARFLCRLFRADECTIYRLEYGDASRPLVRIGSYLWRTDEVRRSAILHDHMLNIASNLGERQNSVSYRAIDQVKTKYCRRIFLQDEDEDRRISFPESTELEGLGVCAVASPIVVHGAPWGVLEFISDQPHNFSAATRSKVELACTVLSSYFYFQSVFVALDNAANAVNDTSIPAPERKRRFLKALSDIFICNSIALTIRERSDIDYFQQDQSVVATLFGADGEWWFPMTPSDRPPKEMVPLAELAFDSSRFLCCGINEDDKALKSILRLSSRELQAKFMNNALGGNLVLIQLTDRMHYPGPERGDDFLMILQFRKEIAITKSLMELFVFFGSFVFPLLETFYSSENWERVLRNRLGHEMNKIWMNVKATHKKFEDDYHMNQEIRFSTSGERHKYQHLIRDLNRHANAIKLYSEILSRKRDSLTFRYHPHVFIARSRMASEERSKLSIRQLYDAAFMSRSKEFAKKGIDVDVYKGNDVVIYSYEWLVFDVLQTLADNVLKYALPGSSLIVTLFQGGLFGNVRLRISNLAPELTEEDKSRLFTEGGRGAYAQGKPGQGIGLFLAHTILMEAGYDLSHEQRPPDNRLTYEDYAVVWHDFTLAFPSSVLLDGQN